MLISIEGPVIPDTRDASVAETECMEKLLEMAYAVWLKKPRRI
jgi:hypothetical protein